MRTHDKSMSSFSPRSFLCFILLALFARAWMDCRHSVSQVGHGLFVDKMGVATPADIPFLQANPPTVISLVPYLLNARISFYFFDGFHIQSIFDSLTCLADTANVPLQRQARALWHEALSFFAVRLET